jgi:carnosine N-methyltransferase
MSSISNEMEEYLHWRSVRATVLKYRDMSYFDIDRRRRRLTKLIDTNPLYKTMLAPDIVDGKHLRSLEEAIDINQDFLDALIDYHDDCGFAPSKPNSSNSDDNSNDDDDININFSSGQHRNHAILHSFYREWSEEGKDERESCFDPIIQELASHFNPIGIPYQKRILVPGCGLARLPLEIVRLGLCCEGNEFSAYMCVGSNFVLNGIVDNERFTIYPWLDRGKYYYFKSQYNYNHQYLIMI